MAPAPFQPIPDSTQVHVDRLVGTQVGGLEVGAPVGEGRFGTIYRARQAGRDVTLEVLRTGLTGDDQEVKASNAIKCAGIANVSDFGQLPDGRRYRVMELLEGESLDQLMQSRGKFSAADAVKILGQVAEVLEAAHAWAVPHGNLGPSSIFVVGGGVKLIDFGLAKRGASIEGDLYELGELGFALLTGAELGERAPPPLGSGIPEPVDRLLRELLDRAVTDATSARKEFALALSLLDAGPATQLKVNRPAAPPPTPSTPAPARRRGPVLGLAAVALVLAGSAALYLWPPGTPVVPEVEAPLPPEEEELLLEEEPEQAETQAVPGPVQTGPRPPSPGVPRRVQGVPSASALAAEISRLESRFYKQVRPGEDVDQALFVLNKQRLRLTGSPTEQDRKDVAKQLAGWRRSYLRR
ncbi:MAG: protein kinase [Archangium sp.]|nr:protein kinase [Archangium sp.]